VISSSYSEGFRKEFHKEFHKYCLEKNIVAEFTRFHPVLKNERFSWGYLNINYSRKTVVLDLTRSKEEIWNSSYSSTNRNMIRKAKKNNVEIFESDSIEDYNVFHSIYNETMNNVNSEKYLYFNKNYFLNFKMFLPKNHKLILAKYDNQIVGGMILMYYGDYAHYHLSARKSEYGRFALNNLFLDYAIDLSKKLGCKTFHFGGGTSSKENDSLLKFKSNFSKRKEDFYIGKKIHNQLIYNEIVNQWKHKYPMSYEKNKNLLLGYRGEFYKLKF